MPSTIPLGDLRLEYARIRDEIDSTIERVLRQGWFILGPEVEAFEAEWAAYCGVAHGVGVGSGTDALQLVLRAAGIGAGDEVIVPALGPAWTALAVSMAGATPVFADIDPERYTLDPAAFEAAITPRTAAVVPVHLYGCPADMAPIADIARQQDLLVIEDAAQAHGARYRGQRVGGLGNAAIFSFYPTKNLGAYGDAGAVVTGDETLAAKVRMLRHGGQAAPHDHQLLGTNSRMDEIHAAILRVKLQHLDGWNRKRQALASRYDAALGDYEEIVPPPCPEGIEHVYHLYVVRTPVRPALRDYLIGAGVTTGIHHPRGAHQQPAYAALDGPLIACPRAEAIAAEALTLPLFPQLSRHEVDQISRLIRFFFAIR